MYMQAYQKRQNLRNEIIWDKVGATFVYIDEGSETEMIQACKEDICTIVISKQV